MMSQQVINIRPRNVKASTQMSCMPATPMVAVQQISFALPAQTVQHFETSVPKPSLLDAPTAVKSTYEDDLNIIKIHEAIVARFASLRGQIPAMEARIAGLTNSLDVKHYSIIQKKSFMDRISVLRNDIRDLDSGTRWQTYITAAKPLLEEYIPLSSDEVRGIVKIGNRKPQIVDISRVEQRLDIIEEYIKVASRYIDIDVSKIGVLTSKCPNCGIDFSELHIDDEFGLHLCECGYERENLSKGSSFKDAGRVNAGTRNNYDDLETFERGLSRYEGKYPDKIPDALYASLDEYYVSKGFFSSDYIRELPVQANGHKEGTSISLLVDGLSKTNNAAYYNSVSLIAHRYWGWVLPNLDGIRDRILESYTRTQKVHDEIKTRDSSLNVNIRIYLHLKAEGFPCAWEDFKILSSRDSLEYHQNMWKTMCSQTGTRYIEII